MYSLAIMVLLAKDEPQSFSRFLVPLLTVVAIAVFGWLSEKAKKKEQQRQAEEHAKRQQESQAPGRQARPLQPPAHPSQQQPQRGPRSAQSVRRYQPEIPGGPEQNRDWRGAPAAEPRLIVVAEDVSAELDRRQLHEEGQRQLHAQAERRTKDVQAQRRQRAALQARQADKKAAEKKRRRELHDGKVGVDHGISEPAGILLPQMDQTSPAQLRRAIVWAEILGPPRALRPQKEIF